MNELNLCKKCKSCYCKEEYCNECKYLIKQNGYYDLGLTMKIGNEILNIFVDALKEDTIQLEGGTQNG